MCGQIDWPSKQQEQVRGSDRDAAALLATNLAVQGVVHWLTACSTRMGRGRTAWLRLMAHALPHGSLFLET
jgi:hypothetical protein